MYKKLVYLMSFLVVLGPACSAGALPEGLVGWWSFDEGQGTTAVDRSGTGNDGTLEGNPLWVAGRFDGGLEFDGASYVNCGNDASLQIRDALTLAVWMKIEAFSSDWEAIVAMGDDSYRMSRSATTGSSIHFGCNGPTGGNLDATTLITDDTWHHAALVYDGTRQIIYIDGVEDASVASTGQINVSAYDFHIGDNAQQAGRYLHGVLDDVQLYNRALSPEELLVIMSGIGPKGIATDPVPADEGTDFPRDGVLSWTPGRYAQTHDVYLGTSFDDVNAAEAGSPLLVSQGQSGTMYDPPGRLEFGRTYYWRVDEVNAPPGSDVYGGEVWSFTVEPLLYAIEGVVATSSIPSAEASGGPQAAVDGSGLTDGMHGVADETMWSAEAPEGAAVWMQFDFDRVYKLYGIHVWNFNGLYEGFLGFGFKDVTIEYATEPNAWMPLGDFQLEKATSKATYAGQVIDLDGVSAQSVRINVNSNFSGRASYGLAEIQFLHKPVFAREPNPADGGTDVGHDALLSWRPGREAASHQVHLGTDADAVAASAALAGAATISTFDPGPLTLGTTYYWKVDEVNEIETPVLWDSALWHFTTQEFVPIDDFESYRDEQGSLIYDTWLDGYGITENGSQVGHDNPPYAEIRIRYSGAQAMPLYYENIEGVAYSEAELALSPPQDFTANGADTLSLHYRGDPTGFVQISENNILMSGIGDDIWGTTDQFRFVYKQLTGNGSIVARVEHVDNTNEWTKAGVMVRETLDADAVLVDGVVTPTQRICMQWRTARAADMGSPDAGSNSVVETFEFPQWVKLTRNGNVFKVQHSEDGVTWLDIVPDVGSDPTEITQVMPMTVYIGLAVCSHNADAVAGAHFTEIATTGNVTGQWQSVSIGAEQPAGNGLDRLYLVVEDASGRKATFANPSAVAVGIGSWRQWTIPLSDITAAGVDAGNVAGLYLGVGDRTQPSKNVSGVLYFDDIAFGHPMPTE